jgi:glycosyltransferase involved in cell wall biosynthesis
MYYRIRMPLEELGKHDGFDVTLADAGDAAGRHTITARQLEGYDVIVGQRLNKHGGMAVWRGARTPFSRLVYELDDDIFAINPENWQAYKLFRDPVIQDAIIGSAQAADLITVTTSQLAEVMTAQTGNPAVAVLPNCVPGWVCDTSWAPRNRPSIGWQGGASHGADIGLIVKPARQFLKRFPGWDLRLAGTDYRPTFRQPKERAVFTGWAPVNDDPAAYYATMDFTIGLAPLLENTFNAAKSSIKVLEYFARGIPVIASDVPAYRDTVVDGVNGFLIRYEHDWLKRMSELAGDEKLLAAMSAAARDTARQHTIETGWRAWAGAYRAMFGSRVP